MEFLKELFNGGALTYEQLETAAKGKGFSVVNASGGAYVPKDQVDTLTSQLSAANKKLEGYDPNWKQQAEADRRKLEAMQFDFALEKGVSAANPRNARAVMALIDRDKLKFAGGELIGLEKQLEELKKGDDMEMIYEEVLADAYAGMNRFATVKSAVQYQDTVRSQTQRGTDENKRATRDTRGAPEHNRYSYDENDSEEEYRKPITQQDVITLRSIGRKSVNEFSPEDIQKTKKWAYKFYQELGVKSPFFRAWFGDWRANDTKTKVKFVTVNAESIERSDVPRGTFFNKDTQWSIKSNSDGIDETTSKSGKWSDDYHALSDIDKMLENAVLLDTVVVNSPSKRLGENAAFMHHLYCPIYVNGEAGLAKIYVAETFRNDHKFYLLKIEKASSDMGFNYVSEVSTPDSEAASEDAAISVADIFSFVKDHDVKYEENSAYPVHFSPKRANSLFMNEDGTPKVFYHGSKKNGGFTVFRDWQYFTEQKRYAERYTERGNQKSLYEVYLTADKVFDTRDEDAAHIFESILQEYGLTELQDTGLPDWTDGYDITEYLSEHQELGYDAVLLDEGGDLVNGEPVSRGLSIVIKDSSQVKSATDNLGTFDRNNKDIRFSFDDEDYMLAVESGDMYAAQEMVDEAAQKAGYGIKAFHGTTKDFVEFGNKGGKTKAESALLGFWFSNSKSTAREYSTPMYTDLSEESWDRIFEEATKIVDEFSKEAFSLEKSGISYEVVFHEDVIEKYFSKYLPEDHDKIKNEGYGFGFDGLLEWQNDYLGKGRMFPAKNREHITELMFRGVMRSLANEGEYGAKPRIMNVFLRGNFLRSGEIGGSDKEKVERIRRAIRAGKDGVVFKNVADGGEISTHYVVFDPRNIKSSDPVTYDDDGKIIPISERFNQEKTDIRYSFEEDVAELDEAYRQEMDSEPMPHRTAEDLKREIKNTLTQGNAREQEPTATVTLQVPESDFYQGGTTVTHTYGRGKPFYSKTTTLDPKEAVSAQEGTVGADIIRPPLRVSNHAPRVGSDSS